MYQIYSDDTLIYDDSVPTIYSREDVQRSEAVDFSQQDEKGVFINGSNIYKVNASYKSVFVEIPTWARSVTLVKSGTPSAFYTMLTSNSYSNNGTPAFATGYDSRIQYTGAKIVTIPSDARYVWVYTYNGSSDITPSMQFDGIEPGTLVERNGAVNPKLNLTAGAAGSLELTLTPVSAGYNVVQRLVSTIHVLRDGTEIWRGRVLSESSDLWKDRNLMCEGTMAFLNDSIYLTGELTAPSASLIYAILSQHNSRVAPNRQIQMGVVDGAGTILGGDLTLKGDVRSSLEALNSLVSDYGGITRTRIQNGVVYLDWLAAYPATVGDEQVIRFGENMMDYAPTQDCADYATAVYVRGAEIQDSEGQGTGTFYNSGWVSKDPGVVARYGVIERFVDMSDLQSSADCATEAVRWLSDKQYDDLTISVSALDLHVLDPEIKPFDLLEKVRVESVYHGINKLFGVVGLSLNLDDPAKTSFTLADPEFAYHRRIKSLTEQTVQEIQTTQEQSAAGDAELGDAIAAETEARLTAIEETIRKLNAGTRGYVTIDYSATEGNEGTDGIYITDQKLSTEDGMSITERINDDSLPNAVQKYWKWTMDGLGFLKRDASVPGGWDADIAITSDGEIMCNFIKLFRELTVYQDKNSNIPGGYLGYGNGKTYSGDVPGIHIYTDTGAMYNEVITTSTGARMSSKGYSGAHNGQANVTVLYDSNTGAATVTVDGDLVVNGNITASGSITPNV